MGPSGRRGVVIPIQGRWPARLTADWSRQRPVLVINEAPEMLSPLAYLDTTVKPSQATPELIWDHIRYPLVGRNAQ